MRWDGKKSEHDSEGHLKNMEVWDWIVTKDGRTRQITHDDMPNLHYSQIDRFATKEEVRNQIKGVIRVASRIKRKMLSRKPHD